MELLGLLIGTGGWFCSLAATVMPQWRSLSTELLATESIEQGLWEDCVMQEVVGIECRPHDTILGLDNTLTLARFLMCLSNAASLLGILLAIPRFPTSPPTSFTSFSMRQYPTECHAPSLGMHCLSAGLQDFLKLLLLHCYLHLVWAQETVNLILYIIIKGKRSVLLMAP